MDMHRNLLKICPLQGPAACGHTETRKTENKITKHNMHAVRERHLELLIMYVVCNSVHVVKSVLVLSCLCLFFLACSCLCLHIILSIYTLVCVSFSSRS